MRRHRATDGPSAKRSSCNVPGRKCKGGGTTLLSTKAWEWLPLFILLILFSILFTIGVLLAFYLTNTTFALLSQEAMYEITVWKTNTSEIDFLNNPPSEFIPDPVQPPGLDPFGRSLYHPIDGGANLSSRKSAAIFNVTRSLEEVPVVELPKDPLAYVPELGPFGPCFIINARFELNAYVPSLILVHVVHHGLSVAYTPLKSPAAESRLSLNQAHCIFKNAENTYEEIITLCPNLEAQKARQARKTRQDGKMMQDGRDPEPDDLLGERNTSLTDVPNFLQWISHEHQVALLDRLEAILKEEVNASEPFSNFTMSSRPRLPLIVSTRPSGTFIWPTTSYERQTAGETSLERFLSASASSLEDPLNTSLINRSPSTVPSKAAGSIQWQRHPSAAGPDILQDTPSLLSDTARPGSPALGPLKSVQSRFEIGSPYVKSVRFLAAMELLHDCWRFIGSLEKYSCAHNLLRLKSILDAEGRAATLSEAGNDRRWNRPEEKKRQLLMRAFLHTVFSQTYNEEYFLPGESRDVEDPLVERALAKGASLVGEFKIFQAVPLQGNDDFVQLIRTDCARWGMALFEVLFEHAYPCSWCTIFFRPHTYIRPFLLNCDASTLGNG